MKWNFQKQCLPLPIREALRPRRRKSPRAKPRVRLWLEALEDRTTPSVVDLTSAGSSGSITDGSNTALFVQSTAGAGGTGNIQSFVRMEQNNSISATTEQGYNTDSRPVQFDELTNHTFTHAFQLSSVAEVNNGGTLYYEFLLDINQNSSASGSLLSLDQLRLYVSPTNIDTSSNNFANGYNSTTGTLGGLSPVYDMNRDLSSTNFVELNGALKPGSGTIDMTLFVPVSALGTNPNTFIYLYSAFGGHTFTSDQGHTGGAANDGFEEWANTSVGTPTITTSAGPNVVLGSGNALTDSATLTGGMSPTGTITFQLFAPNGTTPVFTNVVTVNGNGTYHSTDPGSTTGSAVPTMLGTYQWVASYSGDLSNSPVNSTMGQEPAMVEECRVLLTPPTEFDSVGDQATFTAEVDTTADGINWTHVGAGVPVTFSLVNNSAGATIVTTSTGTNPANTDSNGEATVTITSSNPGSVNIHADTTFSLAGVLGTFNCATGMVPSDPDAQKTFVMGQLTTPTITTSAGPNVVLGSGNALTDMATLSGGNSPTGTITFTLFDPTSTTVYTNTVMVTGNATYHSTDTGMTTGSAVPTMAGTYQWVVSYSGDSNNDSVSSALGAEPQIVNPASPTITTLPIALPPRTLQDSATLAGGFNPTGSITFELTDPFGALFTTQTVTVNGNGTYSTTGVMVSTAGVWHWVAVYSGDSNNHTAVTGPTDEPVTIPPEADLALTKTVDNPTPIFGTLVTFTLTVTNKGPDTATNVVLEDTIQNGLDPVSATVSQGTVGHLTPNPIRWDVGMLINGASAVMQLTVQADAVGLLVNNAGVAGDQLDPTPRDNLAQATVTVLLSPPQIGKGLFLASTILDPPTVPPVTSGSGGLPAAGSTVAPLNAALPFTDSFTTPSDRPEMSPFWTDQSGAMIGINDQPTGVGDFNLSTLNGVNQTDVSVVANANLGVGQSIGLVARYGGPGQDNFYLGQLMNMGYGFVPSIWINSGGFFTLLALGPTLSDGNGPLEFEPVGDSLKLISNGKLVASAFDSTFTSGSVGMRLSQGTVVSSFQANAVVPQNGALPFTDNFATTSDGSQLSRFWSDQLGNISVIGGQAVGQADSNLSTVNGMNAANVSVTGNIALSGSQWAALVSRYSGPAENNFYLGQLLGNGDGTFTPTIWKNVNGVWTKLNTGVDITSASGTLEFETNGPSLKLILNNQILTWADDTDLTSGSVGMRISQNATLGNFQAVTVTPIPVTTLPLNDNFSTTSDGSQPNLQWTDQTGNLTVIGGQAVGQGAFNLSTVNGLNVANVSVTGSIALSGSQWAALVSRYSGPMENNFYLGQLLGNGNGTFTPTIWKKVNGVWTKLNTGVDITSASGTLEFETNGPSLKLILNNQILTWADDTDLTSGSVGMRISQNATLGNFQAVTVTPIPVTTLPLNDNFSTTSDGSQPNLQWTDQTGNLTVIGGQAVGQGAFNLSTVNGLNVANVSVTGSIALSGSQWAALVSRYSGPLENNFYLGQLLGNGNGTFTPTIWKKVNGVWTKLNTGADITSASGTLEFETNGPSLKLILNNQILTWADDTDLTSGSVGMRLSQNATMSNFAARAVVQEQPPPLTTQPFSDNFSTTSDGSQLDPNWTDQNGNTTVVKGLATGEAAGFDNLSTVIGINQANVTVEASIALTSGQAVGLVTRYGGTLDGSYYLGQLYNNGSGVQATIWKHIGGTFTLLTTGLTVGSGTGTLKFQTMGSTLQLFLDGNLLATITDTDLTSGSVGMRLGQNATLGSFNAF
jgi:uncharacterized repeat protein (TIGR01451 family)